jgi:predicted glycoside hydrolase/deacetylase ChbG (UPF0249 family)
VIAEVAHQVAFGERHAVTTTMAAEARTAPPQRLRADDPALRVGVHAHLCAAGQCVAQPAQEKGLLPTERLADLLRAETVAGSRQALARDAR